MLEIVASSGPTQVHTHSLRMVMMMLIFMCVENNEKGLMFALNMLRTWIVEITMKIMEWTKWMKNIIAIIVYNKREHMCSYHPFYIYVYVYKRLLSEISYPNEKGNFNKKIHILWWSGIWVARMNGNVSKIFLVWTEEIEVRKVNVWKRTIS